jgi:hypothetical protein
VLREQPPRGPHERGPGGLRLLDLEALDLHDPEG